MTRDLTPRCPRCKYDLTGFELGQTCPECGWRIKFLRPLMLYRIDAIIAAIISMSGVIMTVLGCGYPPLLIAGPCVSVIGVLLGVVVAFRSTRGPHDKDTTEALHVAIWGGVAGVLLVPAVIIAMMILT